MADSKISGSQAFVAQLGVMRITDGTCSSSNFCNMRPIRMGGGKQYRAPRLCQWCRKASVPRAECSISQEK